MATLYVRNFPDELYEKVKASAARDHRSISAEIIALVERALTEIEQQLEGLERIAERRRRNPQPPDAVDTLTMLREDRER